MTQLDDVANDGLHEYHRVWELPETDAAAGRRALAWCTSPDGDLAVLLVEERHLRHFSQLRGWIAWRAPAPFPGEVVVVGDGTQERIAFDNGPAHATGRLALLPDRRFVLANGRTRRTGPVGPWETNARLFSPNGAPEGDFCLGDDIATLIADHRHRLWTSHGDEGIFGGHPESGTGLAAWDTRGRSLWTAARAKSEPALQGLASATEGDHLWFLWYSGRRNTILSRIDTATGTATNYSSPVPDADGIAVRGDHAVLTRRDHAHASTTLTRAHRDGDTWTITSSRRLSTPGPVFLHCAQGRDGVLWLRAGNTWLTVRA